VSVLLAYGTFDSVLPPCPAYEDKKQRLQMSALAYDGSQQVRKVNQLPALPPRCDLLKSSARASRNDAAEATSNSIELNELEDAYCEILEDFEVLQKERVLQDKRALEATVGEVKMRRKLEESNSELQAELAEAHTKLSEANKRMRKDAKTIAQLEEDRKMKDEELKNLKDTVSGAKRKFQADTQADIARVSNFTVLWHFESLKFFIIFSERP